MDLFVERTAIRILKECQRDLAKRVFDSSYAQKTTGEMTAEELCSLRYYVYLSSIGVSIEEPIAPAYSFARRMIDNALHAA